MSKIITNCEIDDKEYDKLMKGLDSLISGTYAKEMKEKRVFAESFLDKVNEDLNDVKHSFFRIGFRLSEANKLGYYETLGYDNIIDLAEDKFGFKKSTTYGLMQVYNHCRSRKKGDAAMIMDEQYKDYNYSQLQEISRLKWGGAERLIKPSDNVAKIKNFVSAWNKDGESSDARGCETIDDYMRKTGRQTEAAPTALPAPDLLKLSAAAEEQQGENFQISGKIEETPKNSEPEIVECELIDSQGSDYEDHAQYFDGEDYSQYDEDICISENELIAHCLKKGTGIEHGKAEIYEKSQQSPARKEFNEFVEDAYGYWGGWSGDKYYDGLTHERGKGITIKRRNGGMIILTWSVVAGRILQLIERGEYVTEQELVAYEKWKAEHLPTPALAPLEDPKEEAFQISGKLDLKNEKARRDWLDNFRAWGVWLEVKEVDKTFYRYDFVNGAALIVEVGFEYWWGYGINKKDPHERISYSIIDEEHPKFNSQGESYTLIIQWLTKHGKEI